MIGIYFIKCIINNKIYIGSSIDIESRINNHKSCLKHKRHKNPYLQNSWNKYGEENFQFGIIEECKKEDLFDREIYYIELNDSLNSNNGYNEIVPKKNNRINCSKEYSNKISLKLRGKRPLNYELCKEKLKRPILEYENNIFIREYESTKQAGNILHIDYKLINNVLRGKVKFIRKYPNKTWIYKEGEKRKIKIQKNPWKKGKFKKVLQYDMNKNLINTYDSIDIAAKELKVSRNTIMNYCNKNYKTQTKLKYIFNYE